MVAPSTFLDLSLGANDPVAANLVRMKDVDIVRTRLEQLRGQLLQWGTPDLMVFATTKDELRGVDPRARMGPGKDVTVRSNRQP